MKTTLITITAVLAIIILLISCSTPIPKTTEVILLKDITEKNLAKPNANKILGLYDLPQNKWNGAKFNFENLTDVSYNQINEVKISAQNEWLSNEFEREKEIKSFGNKLNQIITDSENDTIGKKNSSIYVPIAQKLNKLSQSKSQRRILIIYSDLMENTKNISFYKKGFLELTKNPESVKNQLEKMQSIGNLEGIEVYLLFQPANAESDNQFKTVSEFYKKLLEDKGAVVNISANLNF